MTRIDAHSVAAMRDNLIALREMSPMGATKSQVRASVGFLRDVSQNFVRTWRFAGLPGTPRIPASVHTMALPKATSIIYFGGFEPGQAKSRFVPTLVEAPGVVEAESSALEYMLFGEALPEPVRGATPYERRALGTSQFFDGTIYVHQGVSVSRYGVVAYVAYRTGAIHAHASDYHARFPNELRALDHLRAREPFFIRDNVDYLLLSIARDLTDAPDVEAFIRATGAADDTAPTGSQSDSAEGD